MTKKTEKFSWKEKSSKVIKLDEQTYVEIEEGSLVEGKLTGKGKISKISENGAKKILEGKFIEGKLHGKGKAVFIDKFGDERIYEGTFKDGQIMTVGIKKKKLNNPVREILGDILAGEGIIKETYDENIFLEYKGEFRNKKLNGKGQIVLRSVAGIKKERIGSFKDNKLCGQGELKIERQNGRKFGFKGKFENNVPVGIGKIFSQDAFGYFEQEGEFEGKNFIPKK